MSRISCSKETHRALLGGCPSRFAGWKPTCEIGNRTDSCLRYLHLKAAARVMSGVTSCAGLSCGETTGAAADFATTVAAEISCGETTGAATDFATTVAAEAAFVPAGDIIGEREGVTPRPRLQVDWLDWDRARLLLLRRKRPGLTLRERTLDRDLAERDLERDLQRDLELEHLDDDCRRAMAKAAELRTDTRLARSWTLEQTSSKP